jgi:hypothetical protein
MNMKKYILIFTVTAAAMAGCKKGYLDINQNPNFPSTVSAASLVAAAETKAAFIMVDPNMANANVWMDQWAFSPNYAVNQDSRDYKITTNTGAGLWTNLYSTAFDFQKIIDFGVAQSNPALEGIGRTMKSMMMQYAVDVYNDVPYSEAFQGAVNKTPKYDAGKDVYEAIYNDLNLAVTKFNAANASQFPTAKQDLMFAGDKSKWIKLANTIKLRILLRQSGRADRASYITSKLSTDFPGGLASFLQAGESAVVNPGYTNADLKQNPYWANFGYNAAGNKTGNNDFFKAAAYAVQFYTSQTDIRGFFAQKPVGSGSGSGSMYGYLFRGNDMGTQGTSTLTYSDNLDNADIGGSVYRFPSQSQGVFTDFESLFLQSEAVLKGWFVGNAQTLYNSARVRAFTFMFDEVDGAGSGAAYANPPFLTPDARNDWNLALDPVTPDPIKDRIKLILTQKWASLNTINFFEAWAEYRRTVGIYPAKPDRGLPDVPLSSSASRGPHIPWRLKYPQGEYDLNGANVLLEGNIDQFTSKIWWMP